MKEYRDFYFKKAKRENYPARSVYKLEEIDKKYHLLESGKKVLDLGAAPGSWSLYAARKVGGKGKILSCDLQPASVQFPPHVCFLQENIFAPSPFFLDKLAALGPFDLVISDMAPATTGIKLTDQARSMQLATGALEIAKKNLRVNGNFIVKIFMGPDMLEMQEEIRSVFHMVQSFKPKSSRAESKEIFLIGLKFKNKNPDCNPLENCH